MRDVLSLRLHHISRRVPTAVTAGLLLLAAASPWQSALAQAPRLTEIVPASGPAGPAYILQVTIRGVGFAPAGNVVEFGPLKIPDLRSADGTRITFDVPKEAPSRGEVPPMVLTPGEYRVTVTTPEGTSNALNFTLTRGP
jgi:hypothetical protein